jgi:hypothetical protein
MSPFSLLRRDPRSFCEVQTIINPCIDDVADDSSSISFLSCFLLVGNMVDVGMVGCAMEANHLPKQEPQAKASAESRSTYSKELQKGVNSQSPSPTHNQLYCLLLMRETRMLNEARREP